MYPLVHGHGKQVAECFTQREVSLSLTGRLWGTTADGLQRATCSKYLLAEQTAALSQPALFLDSPHTQELIASDPTLDCLLQLPQHLSHKPSLRKG